jgi:hypothetical protein
LPKPRSSKVFAAEIRADAGASALFMISASTSIAAMACARANCFMSMSSSMSFSSVIVRKKVRVWRAAINTFRGVRCKLQESLIFSSSPLVGEEEKSLG